MMYYPLRVPIIVLIINNIITCLTARNLLATSAGIHVYTADNRADRNFQTPEIVVIEGS